MADRLYMLSSYFLTHSGLVFVAAALEILQKGEGKEKSRILNYDKDKYREMILDSAETVLGFFGFDRTLWKS